MKWHTDLLDCRMAVDIVSLGLEFIERYGMIAIFILLVLDGALLLPVFPGEVVLVMAVATATTTGDLVFLILLTTAAGLLGSFMLYGMIRGGGRPLVEKYPGFFMMPRKRRERLERAFRHPVGQTLVMWLRLLPLTRIIVNIPAGLARMPLVRFTIFSTIGLLAYHAAFLWFAFETRRPGSPVATQAAQLQEAYANPAMAFVEANAILTGLAVLALGIVLSIKASRNMLHDPEESTGSLIGTLAMMTLFWGGIALAAATYMDPEAVFVLAEAGGMDVEALAASSGYSAMQLLWGVSIVAILLGSVLRGLNKRARDRRKRRLALRRYEKRREDAAQLRRALIASKGRDDPYAPGDPVPRAGAVMEDEQELNARRREEAASQQRETRDGPSEH